MLRVAPVRGFSTGPAKPASTIDRSHPDYVGAQTSKDAYPKSFLLGRPQRPMQANQVAHDDTDARYGGPAHRWDTRSPEDLQKEPSGFHARGKGLDLWKHQTNEGNYLSQSGLVSFSKTREGTHEVRDTKRSMGAPSGFTYEVEDLDPHHTFDLSKFSRQRFPNQSEVSTARSVPLASVKSVVDHERGKEIRWPRTPRSDLSVDDFEKPHTEPYVPPPFGD